MYKTGLGLVISYFPKNFSPVAIEHNISRVNQVLPIPVPPFISIEEPSMINGSMIAFRFGISITANSPSVQLGNVFCLITISSVGRSIAFPLVCIKFNTS